MTRTIKNTIVTISMTTVCTFFFGKSIVLADSFVKYQNKRGQSRNSYSATLMLRTQVLKILQTKAAERFVYYWIESILTTQESRYLYK